MDWEKGRAADERQRRITSDDIGRQLRSCKPATLCSPDVCFHPCVTAKFPHQGFNDIVTFNIGYILHMDIVYIIRFLGEEYCRCLRTDLRE